MTVKERLRKYIKYEGISERSFCLTIGVSAAFVNSIVKSIQPDKIERITLHYPDLNVAWLITGEGEMIKGSAHDEPKGVPEVDNPNLSQCMTALIEERKRHDEMTSELIRQNGILIDLLKKRTNE